MREKVKSVGERVAHRRERVFGRKKADSWK